MNLYIYISVSIFLYISGLNMALFSIPPSPLIFNARKFKIYGKQHNN